MVPNALRSLRQHPLAFVAAHLLVLAVLYCIMAFLGFTHTYPNEQSLFQWDVGWYKSIVEQGYSFHAGQQSNVAFFPAFPMIWKVLGLSNFGISVVNLGFLLLGVLLLQRTYRLSGPIVLLILSIPSVFFNYIPYSEGVFFFAGALIINGLRGNNWIAVTGVFLACLSRSSSLLFIPLIVFAQLYNLKPGVSNRKVVRNTLALILSAVFSTMLAQFLQYVETGHFFTLFETQKSWGRFLGMPHLFLTSWDESRLIWLDGSAFLVGVTSLVICLVIVGKKFRRLSKTVSPATLFSLGYLALVTVVTLMYSSEDALGGTSVYSLNRFVFATPFFSVFLIFLFQTNRLNRLNVLSFLGISLFTWTLFDFFGYLDNLHKFALPVLKTKLYFGIITAYSFTFLLMSNRKYRIQLWSGVYILNLILQIFLLDTFLQGIWVG